MRSGAVGADVLERAQARFDSALEALAAAPLLGKSLYQAEVYQAADLLLDSDEGAAFLLERAIRFDAAGVFAGGPWADASRLQAPLVVGSLKAGGVYPIVESLSELRLTAIAEGRAASEALSAAEATAFLNDVLALNLDLVFCSRSEAARGRMGEERLAKAERLFALIAERLGVEDLYEAVAVEVEMICAQRPIQTEGVRRMLDLADRVSPALDGERRLDPYIAAVRGPTARTAEAASLAAYRDTLRALSGEELEGEAQELATSLRSTGMACEGHAVLLRQLRRDPRRVGLALGLSDAGQAEVERHDALVRQLIGLAIHPATAQSIYGLAGVLERSLLSRSEVAAGLRRLLDFPLQAQVKRRLVASAGVAHRRQGVTAHGLLVAGALSVLGQPLGVGQGSMPTCQAARGISLWAQHAPAHLLDLVLHAARDGLIQQRFEGDLLDTSRIRGGGLATGVDPSLDPVSLVLVPHLDLLYNEIMRRVAGRGEDGHKWANPGLYGHWVQTGFASVFDHTSGSVVEYEAFVRRFYATHHPDFCNGHELIYPNPMGIFVTGVHSDLIGLHAVSLQRVARDPDGALRVYFFNPNNEGRQDWGQGIKPSVHGAGELQGESSLPFRSFAARLYAFHYNPFEEGDAFAVDAEEVAEVERLARESWGRSYIWAG